MGRVAVVVGLLVLACSCGEAGDRPWAGWSTYESPAGGYRLRYQDPPWKIHAAAASSVELRVPSNAERAVPDAALIRDPKYELRVDVEEGNAQARMDEEVHAASAEGHTVVAGPRPVRTETGDVGVELLTVDAEARRHRRVFLDRSLGGVVALRFEANPDLDEPQVDAMVTGVEVAPE